MTVWTRIGAAIAAATGQDFVLASSHAAAGGGINQCEVAAGQCGRRFFIKLNSIDRLEMFAAEAAGLDEITTCGCIRVPRPICTGAAAGHAFLVLEWLSMGNRGDAAELGRQLAAMHRVTQSRFGWWRNNTIGATHQDNEPTDDWATFWRERRLGFQLGLAQRRGAPSSLLRKGERLLADSAVLFAGHHPLASLLHGDLWGGNYGFSAGRPVIFDPAVYYGDREADLAMTELFGGFPERFHAAYREAWPLDPGSGVRKTLYNLYHVLNHYNLFGGGYAGQAERMLDCLLAECRG